jgi:hypothetical protein
MRNLSPVINIKLLNDLSSPCAARSSPTLKKKLKNMPKKESGLNAYESKNKLMNNRRSKLKDYNSFASVMHKSSCDRSAKLNYNTD